MACGAAAPRCLWGGAWHAAPAALSASHGVEKPSTSYGFRVLMFQLSLVSLRFFFLSSHLIWTFKIDIIFEKSEKSFRKDCVCPLDTFFKGMSPYFTRTGVETGHPVI
jgi:hypothetical protein